MTTIQVGADPTFEAASLNRKAAYAVASLGWLVVPWRARFEGGKVQKVPARKNWTQAGALRGQQEVAEWWVNSPDCIPGVVCGAESGIWVLDVDPRNGGADSMAKLDAVGSLGQTFRVTTPQGGWHLYFAWPPGWEPTAIGSRALEQYPGIDIKAHGGFAAAPGASYVWPDGTLAVYQAPLGPSRVLNAPDWLLETVRGGGKSWSGADGQDWSSTDGTQDGDTTWLQGELARLRDIVPGQQHNEFIRFVFQMRVRGMRLQDAIAVATNVCINFRPAEGREPWSTEDATREVHYTWQRVAPANVNAQLQNWANQVSTPQPSPPSVAEQGEGAAQTDPASASSALPPPSSPPVVLGEPPRAIGPDDENAQDLKKFAKDRLLWIAGGDWLVWDGTRWARDDSLDRHEIVRELGRSLVARAGSGDCGEDERQWLVKRYQRLGTVGGRDTCLNYGRDLFAVAANKLDSDPWALNTPGGLVDLRSGHVRPAQPDDLVTQITLYPVREGATDDVWERVLRERVPDPDDQSWLQRWMGYCLTGLTTEKAILAMHGPANTGKSTITEPFGRAMGTYSVAWDADTIVANSNVNRQEALYRARGARLVTVNEMKAGTRLDEGVIKGATGGDTVVGRALYQGSVEYRPQFKLWVHTNHVPNARDDALLARMLFFGMLQQLDRDLRDPGIKTWLEESEEAGSAVLWWAVRGLHAMQTRGLGRPKRSDQEVEDHALRSDPIRRFIHENLTRVSDDVALPWDTIVQVYHAWCATESIKPMGTTTLKHAFSERGIECPQTRFEDNRRLRAARGWALAVPEGIQV